MRKSTRPRCLVLEQLEDRIVPAGNLLLTSTVPGEINYSLLEYTQQGTLVSTQPIPQAPGATEYEDARGLTVDPSGNINIFDGTFQPSLATLSTATNTWSFQTCAGWTTINNVTYGEVAAYKNFVFASDMATAGQPQDGIVRFDLTGGAPVLFGQGNDYIQVALGQDGLLYGLKTGYFGSTAVDVYNPDTRTLVRSFSLNGGPDYDIRSIAVNSSGQVYAATYGGYIAKYDANGNYLTSVLLKDQSGNAQSLDNIVLDSDGQIAVGGVLGDVFLTDESLSAVQSIQTGQWFVFVTFDHYLGQPPQQITPTFSSLAGPTITVGQPTVTLGGQISAGTQIPPGSVNITLNGVTESAAINPDGTFSAVFDTSALTVSGSPYTITYSYPGNSNFAAIQDTSHSVTVSYNLDPIYHGVHIVHSGKMLPVFVEVTDAAGQNLSAANLAVTAVKLVNAQGQSLPVQTNPRLNHGDLFNFTQVSPNTNGYFLGLMTKGLAAGQYTLYIQIGTDPVLHALTFLVK